MNDKKQKNKKSKQKKNKANGQKLKVKVDKAKFKTEMCKNWIETGHCRYGKNCQFAHGNKDVHDK